MKPSVKNQKTFLYVLIVTLSLLLVALFVINPVINDISVLRREIVIMEKENHQLEHRLANINEIANEWEKWNALLGESEKKIPPISELNEVFYELETIFARMPVTITGVSAGKMENMLEEQDYATVKLEVSARGTLSDKDDHLICFLTELEEFPYLLTVENFTMQYGAPKEILPTLNQTLILYTTKHTIKHTNNHLNSSYGDSPLTGFPKEYNE